MITLTTDFGDSFYAGAMRGAILRVHPGAQVVDITHDVPHQDVRFGALAMAAAAPEFPPAVHVGVVDPGVGTDRSGLVVACDGGHQLVGPDNGLLRLAAARLGVAAVHRIANPDLWRHPVSDTFHGRDVFGPVAAHLDAGVSLDEVGPPVEAWMELEFPPVETGVGEVAVTILAVDPFGNCITNLRGDEAAERLAPGVRVPVDLGGRVEALPYHRTYGDAPPGEPLLVVGTTGYLELAVNQGSAAERLGLARDARVGLHLP